MEIPDSENMKSSFSDRLKTLQPLAKRAGDVGVDALSSKMGKSIAVGAAAGGAIAYALPLVAITTGVLLGAGITAFLKNLEKG